MITQKKRIRPDRAEPLKSELWLMLQKTRHYVLRLEARLRELEAEKKEMKKALIREAGK
jgi:hypothetical protein